jgi:cobalt/nickel transport system ATP-binding protein
LIDFLQGLDVTLLSATHNLSIAAELGERTIVLSEGHELIYDGYIVALLEDRDKLMAANLLHYHRHRHDGLEHGHYHTHDWE